MPGSNYNPYFLLAIIASYLQSRLFIWSSEIAKRDDFPQLDIQTIRNIPIRRINFSSSQTERELALKNFQLIYNRFLRDTDLRPVLVFIDNCLQSQPEASDIVHDLLAFLAKEMLDLNKEKQSIQHEFLEYLTSILRIQPQPDKNGKIGIDSLKYKAELLNYPGDYQKEESHLTFEKLKGILLESSNRKRYLIPLTAGVLEDIEKAYQNNLPEVLQLKKHLQRTDYLINQIVYRLYDLNDEEIRVVEGEVH